MAPQLDAYTIQMRNLHQRYSLSKNVMTLFKTLGERRCGYNDHDELGRWMRTSRLMRKACTDTIQQLAAVMQKNKDPEVVAECTELISGCTEMLALANEAQPSEKTFPLMKLPAEVRKEVYKHYFDGLFRAYAPAQPVIIFQNGVRGCHCLPHESRVARTCRKIDVKLHCAARLIKDEVLAAWYESRTFHFTCGCELKEHLSKNASLRNSLTNVKVHWTGPQSAEGFKLLKQVSSLKNLVLVISKSTTSHISEREQMVQKYFTHKGPVRLSDALGFDDLLELSGLHSVAVQHVTRSQAHRRTDEDRHGLEEMLKEKVQGDLFD